MRNRWPEMAELTSAKISVAYTSPASEPFNLEANLSSAVNSSPAKRSEYLANLRSAVTTIQSQINKELTSRMELDTAQQATSKAAMASSVAEHREEENYGEETQEDD